MSNIVSTLKSIPNTVATIIRNKWKFISIYLVLVLSLGIYISVNIYNIDQKIVYLHANFNEQLKIDFSTFIMVGDCTLEEGKLKIHGPSSVLISGINTYLDNISLNYEYESGIIDMTVLCIKNDFDMDSAVRVSQNGITERNVLLNLEYDVTSIRVDFGVHGVDYVYLSDIELNNNSFQLDKHRLEYIFYASALMLVILSAPLFVVCLSSLQLHVKYILISIPIGLAFMVAFVPMAIPDEQYHYNNAYRFSNIILLQPTGIIISDHNDYSGMSATNNPNSYLNIYYNILREPDYNDISINTYNRLYYNIGHIVPSIGIALARILRLNFFGVFYMGRFFNLLFFVSCTSYAIKKAQRLSNLFFVFGLMTMCMQQAASFSYDVLINGSAIVFFSTALSAIHTEGTISKKDMVIIIISSLALIPTKILYYAMVLFVLLIPACRFKSIKQRHYFWGVCAASGILALTIISIPRIVGLLSPRTNHLGESIYYTLSEVLQNPQYFINMLYKTIAHNIDIYIKGLFGTALSAFTIYIPPVFGDLMLLLYLIAIVPEKDHITWIPDNKQRLNILFFSAFIILATMGTMLIGCTPQGSTIIEGVQGRYFIPILVPIIYALRNRLVVFTKDVNQFLVFAAPALQLIIVAKVMQVTISKF